MSDKKLLLKALPKVDEAIHSLEGLVEENVPQTIIKRAVQEVIDSERQGILDDSINSSAKDEQQWKTLFLQKIKKKMSPHLTRMINGTGVVVHTNLGRSLLSEQAMKALTQAGFYYSNLEFNLQTGKRGSRYSLVEDIICELTGAEAALVVNNNAAAVLLCLDTIANGKEVIVSRGQLVEIGGSFRIPEVMKKSGAELVEVGATNRTHLRDYENALTEETALLLKVHTSNFRVIGFTSEISAEELVELGKKHNLPVMEDLGSGSLLDLSAYGLPKEPTVQELVKAGVDVITFSGDKLLGGPQAGIIVGKKKVIEQIKKNQLNRALRIDKFTLSSLEVVLREYYDMEKAIKNVPTLSMLTEGSDSIKKRALKLQRRIKSKIAQECDCYLVQTYSRVGGGAMPEHGLGSWAVHLAPKRMKLSELEKTLRALQYPIIGRIEDEKYLLDMRTIREHEIKEVAELIVGMFA